MSWEAYRWTAKSPSELYEILGPQGVDKLVRQMLDTCWRESPIEGRSLDSVKKIAQQIFDRNMAVWARIKKPSPEAFFENLLPNPADGFLRQAMVLAWMMMPRAGGRDVGTVRKIVGEIYQRNLANWQEDEATFTGKKHRKRVLAKVKAAKPSRLASGRPKRPRPRRHVAK